MSINDFGLIIHGAVSELSWEERGKHVSRFVDTVQVGKTLANVAGGSGIFIPPNCRYLQDGVNTVIAYEIPPLTNDFKYHRRSTSNITVVKDVPYPRGLTILRLRRSSTQYHLHDVYQFALAGPVNNLSAPLYYWPFSNMYEDGRVCIGETRRVFPTLESTAGFPQYIYIGTGNDDLSAWNRHYKTKSGDEITSALALIKSIEGAPRFPADRLLTFNSTMGDCLKNLGVRF